MNNSADRDYYTDNLVEVNKSNAVIASENIYNAKGALLVPKGAQIQPEVAQRIISHKLAKPIEDSISLAKSVDGLHLPQHFSQMPTHPEVIELFQTKLSIDILANESARLDHYPLLNQKLTVLSERFPEIYKKTVFGAYLSLLLCQERGFDDTKTHHCFIASLARDLGLLHINPEIILETGDISGTDWRLLQGHVAISYHILTLIPNIPEKVMTAVLEHHERTDGFGYPRHKIEADLSEEGQVVAFADMVIALFYKYIFGLGYSLQALVPVIQVNAGIHMHENSQAALRLFKTLVKPMKQRHSQKELPQLVARLAKCHPMIDKLFNDAVVFNSDLSDKYLNARLRRTTQLINALKSLLITSGLDDDLLIDWISSLDVKNATESDILEVEKYALMLNEGIWKVGELLKKFVVVLQELKISEEERSKYAAEFSLLNALFNKLKKTMAN